jgi:hypothetical protein
METLSGGIGAILTLILGCVFLILALTWLVLPWILMSKLDKVTRELQEANRHLAYQRQLHVNNGEQLATMGVHMAKVGTFLDRYYPADQPQESQQI